MENYKNQPIRALSWKQPYASLMLHDKIETRTWNTKYRGAVLICASKKPYKLEQVLNISDVKQTLRINNLCPPSDLQHLGKAIAVGYLVDCRMMQPEDADACFVSYNSTLYCHIYQNVRPIEPFDFKGRQGWKILDSSIWDQIRFTDTKSYIL